MRASYDVAKYRSTPCIFPGQQRTRMYRDTHRTVYHTQMEGVPRATGGCTNEENARTRPFPANTRDL